MLQSSMDFVFFFFSSLCLTGPAGAAAKMDAWTGRSAVTSMLYFNAASFFVPVSPTTLANPVSARRDLEADLRVHPGLQEMFQLRIRQPEIHRRFLARHVLSIAVEQRRLEDQRVEAPIRLLAKLQGLDV